MSHDADTPCRGTEARRPSEVEYDMLRQSVARMEEAQAVQEDRIRRLAAQLERIGLPAADVDEAADAQKTCLPSLLSPKSRGAASSRWPAPKKAKSADTDPEPEPEVVPAVAQAPPPAAKPCQYRHLKRVPLPALAAPRSPTAGDDGDSPPEPNRVLREASRGWQVDWARVEAMARSIADPQYTLRKFHADLEAAFPELSLYLLEGGPASGNLEAGLPELTSSGRTIGDEYQRTMGAFFAIYWLLRLPIDGREGFALGVDESDEGWRPLDAGAWEESASDEARRRLEFYREGPWAPVARLLRGAGLVESEEGGRYAVNTRRVMALLALTAIHDIMKVEVLLPTVQPEHAPYHSYNAGDVIGDHDHALSYVMDYYPNLLPSFSGLDDQEQSSVQSTQCELCFNNGWFVQAEAPPGAIFQRLREAMLIDPVHRVEQRDIAFYFVHWLTDLAGAEPTPLSGCEKLAARFPLPVLKSFFRSFDFVEQLAHSTETEVVEAYLEARWGERLAALGPPPRGDGAIAAMRLQCMAQGAAEPVLEAFERLPADDRELLSVELARTGCSGQRFSAELAPQVGEQGPALLVYYGPAFLQKAGDSAGRLGVFAEVCRCARQLWPAEPGQAASHVIIRIDAIKALSTEELRAVAEQGESWVMVKRNESEAFIERAPLARVEGLTAAGRAKVLNVLTH